MDLADLWFSLSVRSSGKPCQAAVWAPPALTPDEAFLVATSSAHFILGAVRRKLWTPNGLASVRNKLWQSDCRNSTEPAREAR